LENEEKEAIQKTHKGKTLREAEKQNLARTLEMGSVSLHEIVWRNILNGPRCRH